MSCFRHPGGRSPLFRHPDVSRDQDFPHVYWLKAWVPAFAGMTEIGGVLREEVQWAMRLPLSQNSQLALEERAFMRARN